MAMRQSANEQLRAVIQRAGKQGISRYRLAKLAGVTEGQLSRLMNQKRDVRLSTAERIVEALGGEIKIIIDQ